jgi:hypothetical protein
MNLRSCRVQSLGRSRLPNGTLDGELTIFRGWRYTPIKLTEASGSARQTEPTFRRPLVLLVLLLMGMISLPGCGGCWSRTPTSAKKTKKDEDKAKTDEEALAELEKKRKKRLEKPKDDFEPLAVRMLPSNDPSPSLKQPPIMVKPGHWIAVSETAKTNNFDFPGELATFVEQQATNQPLTVEETTARLWSWCPAVLPKGQSKRIEGMFYVPRREKGLGRVYSVRSELHGIRGGRTEVFNTTLSPSLKDYEHLIVVLASGGSTPAAYTHFDRLFSVRMPQVEAAENETLRYYHVFRPSADKSVPLPSHPLAWTTIAYVFWDDLDPAVLTNLQQQAFLDWLHWGGQLVISGPSSLDKLKGSFLAPYLPGESTQTVKLEQAAFDDLNQRYSLERDRARVAAQTTPPKGEKLRKITVLPERPMVGVELKLHPAAQPMEGTGGLVVERRVGGGRVVVTRFPLIDVRIKQWKSFDGFFNAVLLRRPPRVFSESQLAMLDVKWDDANLSQMRLEPRLGSTLRYFSRDVGYLTPQLWLNEVAAAPQTPNEGIPGPGGRRMRGGGFSGAPVYGAPGFGGMAGYGGYDNLPRPDTSTMHPGIDDWHFAGYASGVPTEKFVQPKSISTRNDPGLPDQAGVAAWNDDGAASEAARQILTEAAGIEIPSADFVLKVLAAYLFVLVPLNWLIFWLIGKVEWAWIAAPLISLVGAGAVIRLAQLDIGFARSRTEVAVLEVQEGYERAHLTRYTALYSSLSSSYTLAFDEPSSLSAPFPAKKLDQSLLSISNYSDVAFRRDKEASLAGVQVSSNSTGMVHSEQMVPLGNNAKTLDTLELRGDATKGFSINNGTELTVRDIGVFRRVDRGGKGDDSVAPQIEAAYIAKLDPGTSKPVVFQPVPAGDDMPEKAVEDTPQARQRRARRYPNVWLDTWDKIPIFTNPKKETAESDEEIEPNQSRVRLWRLAELAAKRLRLLPGDVRLIGWTDQKLPGLRIRPEAPQNATYTLVLAHLRRGQLPPVRPDTNVADDYLSGTLLEAENDPNATEKEGIDYEPMPTDKTSKPQP